MGLKNSPAIAQVESMSDDLRNSIWNILDLCFISSKTVSDDELTHEIWWHYFKRPVDTRPIFRSGLGTPSFHRVWKEVRDYYFACPWNEVYDFAEFLVSMYPKYVKFGYMLDNTLEQENSGYRLIAGRFSPIVDPSESQSVSDAVSDSFHEVGEHLRSALALLSDRLRPDYRNSIKESISAVEAAARILSGKPQATLGDALTYLEKSGALHGALKGAFSKLYGYTSDADGIRHSLMGESDLTQADARYFLVVCSAFVNLLKVKGSR